MTNIAGKKKILGKTIQKASNQRSSFTNATLQSEALDPPADENCIPAQGVLNSDISKQSQSKERVSAASLSASFNLLIKAAGYLRLRQASVILAATDLEERRI